MGVGFLKLGIVLATCILGVGFVGSGYALIGLLNYTAIEDQGIRQVHFRRPEQRQVWKDLVGTQAAMKTYSQGTGTHVTHTDGVALHFREGGRWKVTLYLWSDEFPESDYKAFSDWLKRRLGPQGP